MRPLCLEEIDWLEGATSTEVTSVVPNSLIRSESMQSLLTEEVHAQQNVQVDQAQQHTTKQDTTLLDMFVPLHTGSPSRESPTEDKKLSDAPDEKQLSDAADCAHTHNPYSADTEPVEANQPDQVLSFDKELADTATSRPGFQV